MVEKGLKPVFVMMKPQEHWHLMRTLASSVESGPFNLKEIGDNFSVDIEKPLKPVMDQWIKAGLLEKSGEVYSPTVAGQFWYVTKEDSFKADPITQSVYSPNQAEAWLKTINKREE